jgi:hypothetical protein
LRWEYFVMRNIIEVRWEIEEELLENANAKRRWNCD